MLSENDGNFPNVMNYLRMKNAIPELSQMHKELGYSFLNIKCDVLDQQTKFKLINNLNYLKMNSCDLDRELFNYLHSLSFGGTIVKRGKVYLELVKILMPFITDFFFNDTYWKKIRYFCNDTKEIIDVLNFLIPFCHENIFNSFPQYFSSRHIASLKGNSRRPFTLKHLSRNKMRKLIFNNGKMNHLMMSMCTENLPQELYKYLFFTSSIF